MAGTNNCWNNQIAGSYNQILLNAGTNGVGISTDASAATVNIATGAAVKTSTFGSSNSTSATTVQSGTGTLSLVSTNGTISIQSGTGDINVSTAPAQNNIVIGNSTGTSSTTINCGTGGVSIGATATAHQSTFGSTNSTSATTVQSGSGALNITSTNGALTINSGTGALGISTDASATTVSIATGAAVKTVTIGSTNSTSSLSLNFGGSSGSTLSNYVTTTFTPGISFGGGTTGITYTIQTGQYTRIGNIVYFRILIQLSNKGSSTGNAAITGFPISSAAENDMIIGYFTNLTLTALYTGVFAQINGGTTATIFQVGSAQAVANVTDAGFANGTGINFLGFYFV